MTKSLPQKSPVRRWIEQEMAEAEDVDVDVGVGVGVASLIMRHFPTDYQPGRGVLICARESHEQNRNHLTGQIIEQWETCKLNGAPVIGVLSGVFVGYVNDPVWQTRILKAAEMARRHDAILLATEPNRFIRNASCRCNDKELWDLQASETELNFLRLLTSGVDLMTLCHPDVSPSEERSRQTKRGQRATEFGTATERREDLMPIALAMCKANVGPGKGNFTARKVAQYLGLANSTVQGWVDKYAQ